MLNTKLVESLKEDDNLLEAFGDFLESDDLQPVVGEGNKKKRKHEDLNADLTSQYSGDNTNWSESVHHPNVAGKVLHSMGYRVIQPFHSSIGVSHILFRHPDHTNHEVLVSHHFGKGLRAWSVHHSKGNSKSGTNITGLKSVLKQAHTESTDNFEFVEETAQSLVHAHGYIGYNKSELPGLTLHHYSHPEGHHLTLAFNKAKGNFVHYAHTNLHGSTVLGHDKSSLAKRLMATHKHHYSEDIENIDESGKWMQKAFSGSHGQLKHRLHKRHLSQSDLVSAKKAARKSHDTKLMRQANLALIAARSHHKSK